MLNEGWKNQPASELCIEFHLFISWVLKNEVVGFFIFASWAPNDAQGGQDFKKAEFKTTPKLYIK